VEVGPEAVRGRRLSVLISPDGTRIVYTGRAQGGTTQLYTRRLDQSSPTLVSGSNFIDPSMFFAPDGTAFGFVDIDRKIRKMGTQGGSPITLGVITGSPAVGGSWGDDGTVVVGSINGLLRIAANGGSPQPIAKQPSAGLFPQVLPGSRAVIYNSIKNSGIFVNFEDLDISTLDLRSGEGKILIRGGY